MVLRLRRYHDFSIFQDGASPLSWMFKSVNFNGQRVMEVPDASLCQISSKSVKWLQKYHNFPIFRWDWRPSWISKFQKPERLATSRWPIMCTTLLHFVKIGQTVAEISRFSDFIQEAQLKQGFSDRTAKTAVSAAI